MKEWNRITNLARHYSWSRTSFFVVVVNLMKNEWFEVVVFVWIFKEKNGHIALSNFAMYMWLHEAQIFKSLTQVKLPWTQAQIVVGASSRNQEKPHWAIRSFQCSTFRIAFAFCRLRRTVVPIQGSQNGSSSCCESRVTWWNLHSPSFWFGSISILDHICDVKNVN